MLKYRRSYLLVTEAVTKLKTALTSFPILRNPDFKIDFILETDGSKHGFGAILKQKHGEVEFICAYASSHIMKAQLKYTSDMLELVGAIWGMKHFQHYLRKKFTLVTDNIILKWLQRKAVDGLKASFVKWVMIAQEFDFTVKHVPGKQLCAADLMSRAGARDSEVDPLLVQLEDVQYRKTKGMLKSAKQAEKVVLIEPLNRDVWIQEQTKDQRLKRMLEKRSNLNQFEQREGLWYHTGLIRYGKSSKIKL